LLELNCGQEVSAERLAMTRQGHETKSQHASHARTLGPYWNSSGFNNAVAIAIAIATNST